MSVGCSSVFVVCLLLFVVWGLGFVGCLLCCCVVLVVCYVVVVVCCLSFLCSFVLVCCVDVCCALFIVCLVSLVDCDLLRVVVWFLFFWLLLSVC